MGSKGEKGTRGRSGNRHQDSVWSWAQSSVLWGSGVLRGRECGPTYTRPLLSPGRGADGRPGGVPVHRTAARRSLSRSRQIGEPCPGVPASGQRGERSRCGPGPLGALASPDLEGRTGPTEARPFLLLPANPRPFNPRPANPRPSPRSASDRQVCALRIPLALPSRFPRGQAGDGGAGGFRGGGAGRQRRPRQRWVLTTLRPLDPAFLGRAPHVLGRTWEAPPSLAPGRRHGSPGCCLWSSSPKLPSAEAGARGLKSGDSRGRRAWLGGREPGALQRALHGSRRECCQGRGSWFHPPGTSWAPTEYQAVQGPGTRLGDLSLSENNGCKRKV